MTARATEAGELIQRFKMEVTAQNDHHLSEEKNYSEPSFSWGKIIQEFRLLGQHMSTTKHGRSLLIFVGELNVA